MSRAKGILKSILKALIEILKKYLLGLATKWGLWAAGVLFVVFVVLCLLLWLFLGK